MNLRELAGFLKAETRKTQKYYSVWVAYHQKFSIPFACLALGLLAVPLGVQSSSSRKSAGLGIGLMAFLVYYLLLSAGLVFSEAGNLSPVIGMWMPNAVMGGLGVFLLWKTANDRPVEALNKLNQLLTAIFKRMFRVRFSN
jgi:lipopolysaccharide export system permease protein